MTVPERVAILNTGSSTLKYSIFEHRRLAASDTIKWSGSAQRAEQIDVALNKLGDCGALGHRIVHGADVIRGSAIVDEAVRSKLAGLIALDALHMEPALAVLDAATKKFPHAPQVVAFDTAFHSTLSAAASTYALPREWSEQYGLRRYGFHGLSVDYAVGRLIELLGQCPSRVIVCHLGSGCSMTAVLDGKSIDTTMGFTPLEGLVMGTRAGSVDPGLLLFLQIHHKLSAEEIETALMQKSGLLGISGTSGDLREINAAIAQGSKQAALARSVFIWSARRSMGAMAGVLGGVDCVVFTGGIGENESSIRSEISAALGLTLTDDDRSSPSHLDRIISTANAVIRVLVIAAREDAVILREMTRLL
jgi:acetate kinase